MDERHRHRYEVNPKVVVALTNAGLHFVAMGVDETNPPHHESTDFEDYKIRRIATSSQSLLNFGIAQSQLADHELADKLEKICGEEILKDAHHAPRMEICELKGDGVYWEFV